MSEETRDMLLGQLEAVRASLTDIWRVIDHQANSRGMRDDCGQCQDFEAEYGSEIASEHLDEMPLEVVWEMGEPFAVVLGTGGPHVEIRGGTRHDGSSYSLHGYWGGEHVVISGESITRTGEYFRELVDES